MGPGRPWKKRASEMFESLRPSHKERVKTVCALYYDDRKSTKDISRLIDLHEAKVWNILARYGERWNGRKP
jgi:DNA-directed RNA polymerase specialized sigma subunit